jgi:phosphoglycerate kinase
MISIKPLTPELVKDKVVVVRVDFNVPMKDGKITEDSRIVLAMPTLQFLIQNGAKRVHILTHLGRPNGTIVPELSTKILIPSIEKLLGEQVYFRSDFTANDNRILLHENTRFWKGEKANDPNFVKQICDGLEADLFVLDGFSVAHRAHASVVGLAESGIETCAGRLLESEIQYLSPFLSDLKIKGLSVVVGGAKMKTKVVVLKHFAKTADNIIIGGALANTFLAAQGYDVGESLFEEDELDTAREVLELAEEYKTGIHLPIDVQVASDVNSESVYVPMEDVSGDMKIFDIGPHSIASFCEVISHSHTIIWNGPVGFFEKKPFDTGTIAIIKSIIKNSELNSIIGGGDTVAAIKTLGFSAEQFTHVSTGGGAMLEFLEGKELPGVKVVMKD